MNNIQNVVLEIINKNIEEVKIVPEQVDDDLTQFGIDSITFIRIIVSLEEFFEIEYPDEYLLFAHSNTLNKIANIVSNTLEKKIGKG